MFTVSNGGYNLKHARTFFMSNQKGLHDYLLLIVKSETQFIIGDTHFTSDPNNVIIIDRNTPYQYHNPNGDYANDWLHFDCDNDESFKNTGIIFNNIYPLRNPAIFTLYIQQILWEKNFAPITYQYNNVDMLFQVFLNNLVNAYQQKDCPRNYSPYYNRFQNLRQSIQITPYKSYMPASISQQFGISTSYFQHLYSDFFGISFQNDLINMRMEYAKSLMVTTNLTIEQIAYMCGYSNEVHFYRQFRKKIGMTPTQYRSTKHN